jgi:hypothetical protein
MTTSGSTLVAPDRTVLERLLRCGITEARAREHLRGGWVRVDGRRVEDPAHPAAPPSRVELAAIRRP